MKINECGRSMIEMLGVLAIVGILSVGGIAGYSKAMRTYKVNKLIEEYGIFINSLLEFSPSLKRISQRSSNENRLYLAPTIQSMGILPQNWTRSGYYIRDSTGRRILIYQRGSTLTFLPYVYDNETRQKATTEDMLLCQRTIKDITIQLAPVISYAYMWQGGEESENLSLGRGDNLCNGTNCLRDLNISTITNACAVCTGEHRNCIIAMDIHL